MADIVPATDPHARRLAEIENVARGLHTAGLGAYEVRVEDDVFTVIVGAEDEKIELWRVAMAQFGERVRVELDWTGSWVVY